MDGWDMGIGEVYKKRGVYRKEDRKMQVSRKKKKKKSTEQKQGEH